MGPTVEDFNASWLTPYGVTFHPVVVIGLGKNLLLKSVLGHCGISIQISYIHIMQLVCCHIFNFLKLTPFLFLLKIPGTTKVNPLPWYLGELLAWLEESDGAISRNSLECFHWTCPSQCESPSGWWPHERSYSAPQAYGGGYICQRQCLRRCHR